MPSELFIMLFSLRRRSRVRDRHALGYRPKHDDKEYRNAFTFAAFVNLCVDIRVVQRVPCIWNVSQAAQLQKHNNKIACKAIRLVHCLCPFGKQFFGHLWRRRVPDKKFPSYAHGGIKGRRREAAIAIHEIVTWKLKHGGFWFSSHFFDLAHAFLVA